MMMIGLLLARLCSLSRPASLDLVLSTKPSEKRLFTSLSNLVKLLAESTFPDFRGLVVAAFFVNPPAVGFFFPIGEPEAITAMNAYNKDGQDQRDGDRHRDEPSFGHRGAQGGANFFGTKFLEIDFHVAQQVNGH